VIQPWRRAKRRMLGRVARAPAAVFAEQLLPRSASNNAATSSAVSEPIGREAERRQQVLIELVDVGLERARVALAGGDLDLEALAPPVRDGVEAQSRRGRYPPRLQRRDQLLTGASGRGQVGDGGAEVQPPGAAGADRVVPFACR
jgi:hypothetical protein